MIVDSLMPLVPDAGSTVNQSSHSSDQSQVAAIVILSSPPSAFIAGVALVSFVWMTTVSSTSDSFCFWQPMAPASRDVKINVVVMKLSFIVCIKMFYTSKTTENADMLKTFLEFFENLCEIFRGVGGI